jgi:hypothetical protein
MITNERLFDRQPRLIDRASVLRAIIAITPEGQYKVLAAHTKARNSTARMT